MAAPSEPQEGNGIPWGLFIAFFAVMAFAGIVASSDDRGPTLTFGQDSALPPGGGLLMLLVLEIVWILTVFDLLKEPRLTFAHRALWLAVLVFLNLVGSVFYLLLKKRYLSEKDELP